MLSTDSPLVFFSQDSRLSYFGERSSFFDSRPSSGTTIEAKICQVEVDLKLEVK